MGQIVENKSRIVARFYKLKIAILLMDTILHCLHCKQLGNLKSKNIYCFLLFRISFRCAIYIYLATRRMSQILARPLA